MLHEAKANEVQRAEDAETLQQRLLHLEQAQKEARLLLATQQVALEEGKRLVAELGQERDHWRSLAEGYAKGRVMRLMNWVHTRLRT